MLPLLFLLFILVPLAELYVIIQIGQAIGALPTIGLLLLDSILGTWLLRSQGRLVWARFRAALAGGRAPAREVADGALVITGGALLLAPGFITDVVGALLLLPPSRALVRRRIMRGTRNRLFATVAGGRGGARAGRRGSPHDVDATAHEVDSDPDRLEP